MLTDLLTMKIIDAAVADLKAQFNVRKDPHEHELLSLGESLRSGQLTPIIIDPNFVIIDGWRRWLAARMVALKTLKAIVSNRPLTDSELRSAQLMLSVHRAALTAGEMYQACYELLQLNSWNAKQLAEHLKLDPSMITRILSPSDCIPAVREALAAGHLGLSHCYEISKETEERQEALLRLRLEGASREEMERFRRKPKARGKKSGERQTSIKVPLASGVTLTVSGPTLSLPGIVDAFAEGHKASKKAIEEGLDAKTWVAVMAQKAKVTK